MIARLFHSLAIGLLPGADEGAIEVASLTRARRLAARRPFSSSSRRSTLSRWTSAAQALPVVEGASRLQRCPEPSEGDAASQDLVRFVDVDSRRSDVLGRVGDVHSMSDAVTRLLEGGRAGCRFPLLRLVGRAQPLSHEECEALAREVVRLRQLLTPFSIDELRPAPRAGVCDPALDGAAPLGPSPDPFPRRDAPAPRHAGSDGRAR